MALPGYFFGKRQAALLATDNPNCSPCPPVQNCVRTLEQQPHFLRRERLKDTDISVRMLRKILVCTPHLPVVDCQK